MPKVPLQKIQDIKELGWYLHINFDLNKPLHWNMREHDGFLYELTAEGWRSNTGHLVESGIIEPHDVAVGPLEIS